MLELAILGLLKEQELHGYELKKRLADTFGTGTGVSFGSLYPALGRLEAAGAVRVVDTADPQVRAAVIPMTGSLGGELAAFRARRPGARGSRGKKVYAITERGEALFDELLATESASGEDDRLFHLRLAFARYLPRDARLGMLERRRALLLQRLAQTRARVRHGWERLDAYTRSLIEHGSEITERDITWIERLIALERDANQTQPAAPAPGQADPGGPSSSFPSTTPAFADLDAVPAVTPPAITQPREGTVP